MNTLAQIIETMGLSVAEVSRRTGIPYTTVWRQVDGSRPITAEAAVKYDTFLGIGRHLLRPDLWPKPKEEDGRRRKVRRPGIFRQRTTS